jgi:hypothetical protein
MFPKGWEQFQAMDLAVFLTSLPHLLIIVSLDLSGCILRQASDQWNTLVDVLADSMEASAKVEQ